MGQYANELYAQNYSQQCENRALRRTIDEFKSGKRYQILQSSHEKIISGYKREVKRLAKELAAAHETTTQVRNIWFEQTDSDFDWYQAEMEQMQQRVFDLEKQNLETIWEYDRKIQDIEIRHASEMIAKDEELAKKESIIQELTTRLAHAEALLNRNGTNTGTPTSQTPIGKKKIIPNSRNNTGKSKGGQPGHKQSILEAPSDEDVNDTVYYPLGDEAKCTVCGSNDLIYTGEYEDHYEYDVEINVIKRRHRFYLYTCLLCGTILKSAKGPDFRSKCIPTQSKNCSLKIEILPGISV